MSEEDFQRALAAFDPDRLPDGAVVLQRGRNLTVRLPLAGADAVVKRFPPPSPLRALADRLSGRLPKAERAYLAARRIHERLPGATPEPLARIAPRGGAGLLATRYEPGLVSFTARLAALYRAGGPCPALIALLERVAAACRGLHDAGFVHLDLGNQNILLAPDGRILFVDLNRGRILPGPVPTRLRARDLSRIALPSDFLRVFFEMYWRAPPPPGFLEDERRFRRAFALHSATRGLRHPFRPRAASPEPAYPPPQDIWIWDTKSEQAVPALRPRDRRRHQSVTRVLAPLAALLRLGPAARRQARRLAVVAFGRPVTGLGSRVFVSLSGDPDRTAGELARLERLPFAGVHLRLYAHEPAGATDARIDLARRLAALGRPVAVSLVQCRASVLDPDGWTAFCERVLSALGDLGGRLAWCEYLHAVNRVKWGLWTFRELALLLGRLPALRRRFPAVPFLAPSVIDFEWDYFAAALRLLPAPAPGDPPLAGASAELYVDRRGAPERRQGRFDAVGKLAALRAFAEARPDALADRLVVTEFNWPLAGTGEWSPVGSPYVSPGPRTGDPSVSEADAAAYTVRYLLLGLCSGMADAMTVWSLAAHGFGLVDPGTAPGAPWRNRPGFDALRTLLETLGSAAFASAPLRGGPDGVWALRFLDSAGAPIAVAWNASGAPADPPAAAVLGFVPAGALDMLGNPVMPFATLAGAPVYYLPRPRWNPPPPPSAASANAP